MNLKNEEIILLHELYKYNYPSVELLDEAVKFAEPKAGEYYLPIGSASKPIQLTLVGSLASTISKKRLIFNKPKVVIPKDKHCYITVKDIYVYNDGVEIPEDWEFVSFDIPKSECYFLNPFDGSLDFGKPGAPRIIVKRSETS